MQRHGQEREVLELEGEFWRALKAKDGQRAQEMTAHPCIVVGAQGVSSIDGPTMARMTEEGPWEIEEYEFDEDQAHVRFLGSDVAIVAYKVDERVKVDGETLHFEANDSSVWVRENGEWRCALHTESIVGDPFGRDRA
jgi:ketosteroid isomerase-like protein